MGTVMHCACSVDSIDPRWQENVPEGAKNEPEHQRKSILRMLDLETEVGIINIELGTRFTHPFDGKTYGEFQSYEYTKNYGYTEHHFITRDTVPGGTVTYFWKIIEEKGNTCYLLLDQEIMEYTIGGPRNDPLTAHFAISMDGSTRQLIDIKKNSNEQWLGIES